MARIILVEGLDRYFLLNRAPLGEALLERGHEVWAVASESDAACEIRARGFHFAALPESVRGRRNLLAEVEALLFMVRLYWRLRPQLVHHFTLRPVLFGSLAARIVGGIATVNSITGLGYLFTEKDRAHFLRWLVSSLYRLALGKTFTIVQNPDDYDFVLSAGWVRREALGLIPGSGVDCRRFSPTPEPTGQSVRVVLPGRILKDKGVHEFVEAARLVASERPEIEMILVGDTDPAHPTAINPGEIQSWVDQGWVRWLGFQSDMPAIFASANIVVLPSYREGFPKALLEACACQRAVVGTDVPGVREVVLDGQTGLLAEVRDSRSLARAILRLAGDPELRSKLAVAGRQLAETRSTASIVEQILEVYRGLGLCEDRLPDQ
ncbi:MAG: glycoside hydrolase [Candidatus Xenobia bacterium]